MNPESQRKRTLLGASLVLFSGLCWATYVVTAKLGIEFGLDVISLNTIRLTVSALFIGIFIAAFRRFAPKASLPAVLLVLLLGAIDHGLGGVLYIGSLHYIDASLAYLLVFAYPAMVVLLSAAIGREKLSARKVLAVIVTFIGVAMVLEAGGAVEGEAWIGVALVLAAAFIFSVYLLFCEGLMDRFSSSQMSFFSLAGGGIAMLAALPFAPARFDLLFDPQGLLILGIFSVVGTAFALLFFLMGVRHIGASRASIISTTEPVFVVLLAWIMLGEFLSPIQWLGMLVLMAGVTLVQWGEPAHEPGP